MVRTGIFSGTFDPVHDGHIAFALATKKTCNLDRVVFMPERQPRGKQGVTDIELRVAMLERALRDEPGLDILVLPDAQFTIARTLPHIKKHFAGHELTMLIGSDIAPGLPQWPGVEELYATVSLAVGQRNGDPLPQLPVRFTVVPTAFAAVAASHIRNGQRANIAPGVHEFIIQHDLYRV